MFYLFEMAKLFHTQLQMSQPGIPTDLNTQKYMSQLGHLPYKFGFEVWSSYRDLEQTITDEIRQLSNLKGISVRRFLGSWQENKVAGFVVFLQELLIGYFRLCKC